jgi:hypothetical protein
MQNGVDEYGIVRLPSPLIVVYHSIGRRPTEGGTLTSSFRERDRGFFAKLDYIPWFRSCR